MVCCIMIVLNHQTSLSSHTGCNPQQTGRLLLEGLAGCTSDLVTRAYFLTSRSVSHCSEFFFQCWIEVARCQPLTSCCPPPADMEASRLDLRGAVHHSVRSYRAHRCAQHRNRHTAEGATCVTIGRISVLCVRCGLKVQNVTLADYSTI